MTLEYVILQFNARRVYAIKNTVMLLKGQDGGDFTNIIFSAMKLHNAFSLRKNYFAGFSFFSFFLGIRSNIFLLINVA